MVNGPLHDGSHRFKTAMGMRGKSRDLFAIIHVPGRFFAKVPVRVVRLFDGGAQFTIPCGVMVHVVHGCHKEVLRFELKCCSSRFNDHIFSFCNLYCGSIPFSYFGARCPRAEKVCAVSPCTRYYTRESMRWDSRAVCTSRSPGAFLGVVTYFSIPETAQTRQRQPDTQPPVRQCSFHPGRAGAIAGIARFHSKNTSAGGMIRIS